LDKTAILAMQVPFIKRSDYFLRKKYFTERKKALRYIHPCTLYMRFTVEDKLRFELGLEVRFR